MSAVSSQDTSENFTLFIISQNSQMYSFQRNTNSTLRGQDKGPLCHVSLPLWGEVGWGSTTLLS